MTSNKIDLPDNKGVSPISRNRAYQMASSHFGLALDVVVRILKSSDNDNARLGAARTIIDKVLPDLKSSELSGPEGRDLFALLLSSVRQQPQKELIGTQLKSLEIKAAIPTAPIK